jgi:hypothetical protein
LPIRRTLHTNNTHGISQFQIEQYIEAFLRIARGPPQRPPGNEPIFGLARSFAGEWQSPAIQSGAIRLEGPDKKTWRDMDRRFPKSFFSTHRQQLFALYALLGEKVLIFTGGTAMKIRGKSGDEGSVLFHTKDYLMAGFSTLLIKKIQPIFRI